MRSLRTITLLFVLCTLSACRVYKDVEFRGVKNVKFEQFDRKAIACVLLAELYNPNPYKITLLDSDIALFMEGNQLGNIELPAAAELEAESLTKLQLKCIANPESIPALAGGAIGLIFKKDLVLRGKGSLRAKAFFISKVFPVEFEQRISKEDLGF